MERWFESATGPRSAARSSSDLTGGFWAPELESFLRDDKFVVRLDVPGLNKDEVNVEVTDDTLVIHGERQNAHEEERDGYYRSERTYGRFYREVPLPEGALPETAQANYRDGVLEITVTAPPREVSRPRRVEIGGAASASGAGDSPGRSSEKSGNERSTGRATHPNSPTSERVMANERNVPVRGE
jgi:HSP20 family protein